MSAALKIMPIEQCGAVGKCMASPQSYESHISSYSYQKPSIDRIAAKAMAELEKARATDVATHERNLPAIANNEAVRAHVEAVMAEIGMPRSWSQRDTKSRSRYPKNITTPAGYLTDLVRECRTDDGFTAATNTYNTLLARYREYEASAQVEAERARSTAPKSAAKPATGVKSLGGPATNVAVIAAGLGDPFPLSVELATAVGDDADSDWALGELIERSVDIAAVRRVPGQRLSRCIVFVETGEPAAQHLHRQADTDDRAERLGGQFPQPAATGASGGGQLDGRCVRVARAGRCGQAGEGAHGFLPEIGQAREGGEAEIPDRGGNGAIGLEERRQPVARPLVEADMAPAGRGIGGERVIDRSKRRRRDAGSQGIRAGAHVGRRCDRDLPQQRSQSRLDRLRRRPAGDGFPPGPLPPRAPADLAARSRVNRTWR